MSKTNPRFSQVERVANMAEKIGTDCFEIWEKNADFTAAKVGNQAMRNCLSANSIILQHKRLTGEPKEVKGLKQD